MMERLFSCTRWAWAIFLLSAPIALFAQNSGMGGTVVDPVGAVVSGAEITATNLSTHATRVVTSSGEGNFAITNLPIGAYEVTAKKDTFKAFHVPSVQLTVAEVTTVNITLEPGAVTEEVQVNADLLPAVDLETSQISNLVSQRQMQDLPMVTRDPYSLILLSPGTIQTNAIGGFSVNGSRERDNNFLLDGIDNNDTSVPGTSGGLASLNPDSTQEFRVITNNFMPEYGRNNGAIVEVVTKSGSNDFHGNGYWFGRYNAFGARDYFNHGTEPDGSTEPQNPYVRNLFGVSFGGPIIKDKTFFFVNSDWHRFRTTLTNASIVPSANFRSGVFNYDGMPVDLSSPSSPNNPGGYTLDPTAQAILALYPAPNGPAVDDARGQYFFPSRSASDEWHLTTKVDHHITSNETLSVRYAYDTFRDPNPFHSDFLPGLDTASSDSKTSNIGVSLTSALRPTLVNEAKFGFNRLDAPFTCGGLSTFDGISGVDQFGNGRDYSLPGVGGFGCLTLGELDSETRRTGTWTAADNVSWVRGSHTFKFGGEYRRIFENGHNDFNSRDLLTFTGNTNFGTPFVDIDPSTPCDVNTGDGCDGPTSLQDLSSFLFGVADTEYQAQFFNKTGARVPHDDRQFRQNEYGVFFQDSWKVRRSLTLNLGARYQFNSVPYETNGNLSNLYVDPAGNAPFTFELAGPNAQHQLYNNDFSGIEPRVGFAWSPFQGDKTSIRGAFGVFHDRVFGNLFGNARGNPPFEQTISTTPFDTPENLPFPGDLTPTPIVENGAAVGPTLFDPNLRLPYTENWNFGVQHELLNNLTLEVDYVGTRGVHLLRVVDGNPPDPARVQQLIADGVSPDDLQFAALYFGQEFFGLPFNAVHNNALANPFSFAGAGVALNKSIGNSFYNGLQVNLTKKMSHGLQLQGAYTWSHAIDDAPDPLIPAEGNRSYPRNSLALQNERSNSDNDIRHRLAVNYVWQLPVGKGQRFITSGPLGKAFEGWQLSGITTFQSGHPYDVLYIVDAEHTGVRSRGTLIGDNGLPADHDRTETGPPLADFCVFELGCSQPLGVPGSSGRNHFYGPGINNWDAVVSKITSLGERVKLETRFEFYNLFNRVQFDQPDNELADTGTFGFSSATTTRPDRTTSARQLQFAMKLNF
jgi:Carboxypeptidase regulatory-like domain/TonB dependent receptor